MHSFLPAIGFTNIKNRQQLEPIYRQILSTPTSNQISTISSDTSLIQINKDFGDGFGISLIGEMSQDGALSIEYYFHMSNPIELTKIKISMLKNSVIKAPTRSQQ